MQCTGNNDFYRYTKRAVTRQFEHDKVANLLTTNEHHWYLFKSTEHLTTQDTIWSVMTNFYHEYDLALSEAL